MARPPECSGRRWQAATLPYRRAWAAAGRPCALCHEPINYGLRFPAKRSLTVDHIVAIWEGGAPLDPTNWQPAHLTCNSTRGGADSRKRRARHVSARW